MEGLQFIQKKLFLSDYLHMSGEIEGKIHNLLLINGRSLIFKLEGSWG